MKNWLAVFHQPIWKTCSSNWESFPQVGRGENDPNTWHELPPPRKLLQFQQLSFQGKVSNDPCSQGATTVDADRYSGGPVDDRSSHPIHRALYVSCSPSGTRWAPSSYKWSYNPYKWPYKWLTVLITLVIGVINPVITGRGPKWYGIFGFLRATWNLQNWNKWTLLGFAFDECPWLQITNARTPSPLSLSRWCLFKTCAKSMFYAWVDCRQHTWENKLLVQQATNVMMRMPLEIQRSKRLSEL